MKLEWAGSGHVPPGEGFVWGGKATSKPRAEQEAGRGSVHLACTLSAAGGEWRCAGSEARASERRPGVDSAISPSPNLRGPASVRAPERGAACPAGRCPGLIL